NNHTNDKGNIGIERTYDLITEKGLTVSGTQKNDTDKNYVIKEVKGVKIGILSYSYGEIVNGTKKLNGIPVSKSLSERVNVFDSRYFNDTLDMLDKDLNEMKSENPDIIIFVPHWGNEYQTTPSNFQKNLAQEMSNRGVDIIFGSHPHVVQPIETLTSETDNNHKTTVVYSMGNFISNQRKELISSSNYTEDGIMVNVKLKKTDSGVEVSEVSYIPTWVNRYKSNPHYTYEIIPIVNKEELENIDNLNLNDVKSSYENTKKLINNENIPLFTTKES
ncbi:MAG: CapA family protein, partial [Romboutsia sp.]|nr:CapA family protein [Romboutsia sp.]